MRCMYMSIPNLAHTSGVDCQVALTLYLLPHTRAVNGYSKTTMLIPTSLIVLYHLLHTREASRTPMMSTAHQFILKAKMRPSLLPSLHHAVRKERRCARLPSRKLRQHNVQCHKLLLCQIICLIQTMI